MNTTLSEPHTENFNQHRALLLGIAWRMLGSAADAEDIVQEAFIRWSRTNPAEIRSPRAFLVTVVTRLCLNFLDLARVRKETSFDPNQPGGWPEALESGPADDPDLADALDAAFSVVLKCLSPVERAVFLLREVFECDYPEVARILEKSEENCRQILRRARERIAGRDARFEASVAQQESAVQEFLAATRNGDLESLANALTKDVTLICDGDNLGAIAPAPIHGPAAVVGFLARNLAEPLRACRKLQETRFREVPLLLAYEGEALRKVLAFVLRAGEIRAIYVITCPVRLRSIAAQFPARQSPE